MGGILEIRLRRAEALKEMYEQKCLEGKKLIPNSDYWVLRGITRRFDKEKRRLSFNINNLRKPLPEDAKLRSEWSREIIREIARHHFFDSRIDKLISEHNSMQLEFKELLVKRGLKIVQSTS